MCPEIIIAGDRSVASDADRRRTALCVSEGSERLYGYAFRDPSTHQTVQSHVHRDVVSQRTQSLTCTAVARWKLVRQGPAY